MSDKLQTTKASLDDSRIISVPIYMYHGRLFVIPRAKGGSLNSNTEGMGDFISGISRGDRQKRVPSKR